MGYLFSPSVDLPFSPVPTIRTVTLCIFYSLDDRQAAPQSPLFVRESSGLARPLPARRGRYLHPARKMLLLSCSFFEKALATLDQRPKSSRISTYTPSRKCIIPKGL
jgi:hypothetical protein